MPTPASAFSWLAEASLHRRCSNAAGQPRGGTTLLADGGGGQRRWDDSEDLARHAREYMGAHWHSAAVAARAERAVRD